jgi:hypothetical protein
LTVKTGNSPKKNWVERIVIQVLRLWCNLREKIASLRPAQIDCCNRSAARFYCCCAPQKSGREQSLAAARTRAAIIVPGKIPHNVNGKAPTVNVDDTQIESAGTPAAPPYH